MEIQIVQVMREFKEESEREGQEYNKQHGQPKKIKTQICHKYNTRLLGRHKEGPEKQILDLGPSARQGRVGSAGAGAGPGRAKRGAGLGLGWPVYETVRVHSSRTCLNM